MTWSQLFGARQGLILVGLIAACDPSEAPGVDRPPVDRVEFSGLPTIPLDSLLVPISQIRPIQDEFTLVARVSDVAVSAASVVAVADASEGNVKLYSGGEGTPMILGRRGQGPGEFRRPLFVRLLSDTVFVGDTNAIVHVFSTSGGHARSLRVTGVSMLQDFAVLDNETYVAVGSGNGQHVLFVIDQEGAVRSTLLPIGDVVPEGSTSSPDAWQPFRSFHLALQGRTAFVTSTISDTLWTVDLDTSSWKAERIPGPRTSSNLEVPGAPTPSLMADFARQLVFTYSPVPTGDLLLVPFVSGSGTGRDVVTVARTPDGSWVRVTTEAVLSHSADRTVVGYEGSVESLVLRLFESPEVGR